MDSGWVAFGVISAVAALVAVIMIGVSAASQPFDDRLRFTSAQLEFRYPSDWILAPGDQTDPPEHQVVAHLVTFAVQPTKLCTTFSGPCDISADTLPPGEASIVITAWEGGLPRVTDPVVARPFGLDADDIIGGQPAVFELDHRDDGTTVAWWQLSSPDFPDRWIEVRAEIGGQLPERAEMVDEIRAVLETLRFEG